MNSGASGIEWVAGNMNVANNSYVSGLGTTARYIGISANISGAGGLTKLGGGLLSLGGVNSYRGGTEVSNGTLHCTGNLWLTNNASLYVRGGNWSLPPNYNDSMPAATNYGALVQVDGDIWISTTPTLMPSS